jgi:23S rRNA pseudouridine1911/1915/1917 synthase
MPQRALTLDNLIAPERLDRVLAGAWPDLSRSRLQALIRAGHVAIGGAVSRDPSLKLQPGAQIVLDEPEPVAPEPEAETIPLSIVYEDDEVVVIEKPAGLVVHPAAGHDSGTLVNALIAHCGDSLSGIGGVKRPGIVHRLDKDTTGLMVIAKTDRAHRRLSSQFAEKRESPLQRGYLAFVWGAPDRPHGVIDAPLERHPHAREKRAVREGGREAVTHWQVLERYAGVDGKPVAALLACELDTGRTHQVRVHLAHIGHPIMGDETYATGFKTKAARLTPGAREALEALHRQALHAEHLAFQHPESGEMLDFRASLPPDLQRLLAALRAPNS